MNAENTLGISQMHLTHMRTLHIFIALNVVIERQVNMKDRLAFCFIASFVLLVASAPSFAHHGNAAYDMSKEVTVTGTVTEWIVANPHSFLKLDVKDDNGNVVHWVIESSAASANQARGVRLTRESLKPGDKVTITMMVAKNGQPVGRIHRLVLPDGRMVVTDLP